MQIKNYNKMEIFTQIQFLAKLILFFILILKIKPIISIVWT